MMQTFLISRVVVDHDYTNINYRNVKTGAPAADVICWASDQRVNRLSLHLAVSSNIYPIGLTRI